MANLSMSVENLLAKYMLEEGTTPEGAIRDVMTELMKLCNEQGMDCEQLWAGAWEVFTEEEEEVEPG